MAAFSAKQDTEKRGNKRARGVPLKTHCHDARSSICLSFCSTSFPLVWLESLLLLPLIMSPTTPVSFSTHFPPPERRSSFRRASLRECNSVADSSCVYTDHIDDQQQGPYSPRHFFPSSVRRPTVRYIVTPATAQLVPLTFHAVQQGPVSFGYAYAPSTVSYPEPPTVLHHPQPRLYQRPVFLAPSPASSNAVRPCYTNAEFGGTNSCPAASYEGSEGSNNASKSGVLPFTWTGPTLVCNNNQSQKTKSFPVSRVAQSEGAEVTNNIDALSPSNAGTALPGPQAGYIFPAPEPEHIVHVPREPHEYPRHLLSPNGTHPNDEIRVAATSKGGSPTSLMAIAPSSSPPEEGAQQNFNYANPYTSASESTSTLLLPYTPRPALRLITQLVNKTSLQNLSPVTEVSTTSTYSSPLNTLSSHLASSTASDSTFAPTCSPSFQTKPLLEPAGMPRKGRKSKPRHLCKTCDQTFSRAHDLRRHTAIHTPGTRKCFLQSGRKPYAYACIHMALVKAFECTKCSKAFTRKDALKRHLEVRGEDHDDFSKKRIPEGGWNAHRRRSRSSTLVRRRSNASAISSASTSRANRRRRSMKKGDLTAKLTTAASRRKKAVAKLVARRRSSAKDIPVGTYSDPLLRCLDGADDAKPIDSTILTPKNDLDFDDFPIFDVEDFLPSMSERNFSNGSTKSVGSLFSSVSEDSSAGSWSMSSCSSSYAPSDNNISAYSFPTSVGYQYSHLYQPNTSSAPTDGLFYPPAGMGLPSSPFEEMMEL